MTSANYYYQLVELLFEKSSEPERARAADGLADISTMCFADGAGDHFGQCSTGGVGPPWWFDVRPKADWAQEIHSNGKEITQEPSGQRPRSACWAS